MARRVISMAFVAGKYQAEAVRHTDALVGERIVLTSLLLGQEQVGEKLFRMMWVTYTLD